ncbi:MAG: zinc-binding dehydrogenase [Candidatus Thorarchaeota archaeon]|nr:MAG: zinc-binding dehydrogenase [Candidatus Thorarchaeota archaeon]
MRGLVKTARGEGNLELQDLEEPRPKPNEVLIEVKAAGICGSDIHIKHDQSFYTPPVVLGHEYSGVVVEIGQDVQSVAVGDRIVSPATAYCGQCYHCKTGCVNRCTCPDKRILGVSLADGAFAKFMTVPEFIIHKVPESLSFEEAALAEPTACVVHSLAESTPITPGDVVVVQGPGTMGLLATQVAKTMGAGSVIVTGITSDRWRLDIAEMIGADLTIDVQKEEADEVVKSHSDGLGADVVIEASGAGPARSQALEFVKSTGHISLLGVQGKPTEINLDYMIEKELTMVGTWGTLPSSWVTTLRMMASGQIDVKPLITHKIPLIDWERGFELMESQKAIKVLFTNLA